MDVVKLAAKLGVSKNKIKSASAESVHSRSIVHMSKEFCGDSLLLDTGRMKVVLHRSITLRSFCSLQSAQPTTVIRSRSEYRAHLHSHSGQSA